MAHPPRSERPAMQGYGVTDNETGLLDWQWAEERLLECRNYWLTTVSAGGRPHSMPVWGVWMPTRQRWGFGCAPSARKVRNLRANDRVVVATHDTVECISLEGRAVMVVAPAGNELIGSWVDKYHDGEWPKDEMAQFLRDGALYEVIPDRAFGLIERAEEFSSAATRWVWS